MKYVGYRSVWKKKNIYICIFIILFLISLGQGGEGENHLSG